MGALELWTLDIETTGLHYFKDKILCIGVYTRDRREKGTYHVFKTVDEFKAWNDNGDYRYIAHNGSFDFNWLRYFGCDLYHRFLFDTKSLASILVPKPPIAEGKKSNLSLESLSITLLGGKDYKLDRENMASYSIEEVIAYNEKDCEITWNLFEYLVQNIPEEEAEGKRRCHGRS